MRRVFLIVLDSFGIGQMPDAQAFGDYDVNTLRSCMSSSHFSMPNMKKLGFFEIDGVREMVATQKTYASYAARKEQPLGRVARMREASNGKDTTIGHWEIAGLISKSPLPTYPDGFPQEILEEF